MTTEKSSPVTVSAFKILPPRERDALVAEAKGYVWRRLIGRVLVPLGSDEAKMLPEPTGDETPNYEYRHLVPKFTADRNAIWDLVEHAEANGCDFFRLVRKYGLWECKFGKVGTTRWHSALDDSLALSVSTCFLLAKGAIVPDSQGGDHTNA